MIKKIKINNYNLLYFESENCIEYFKNIIDSNYKIIKSLKDDKRSKVLLIEFDNKKFVYKEPIEKNNRKWQQFVNFFRGSDSFRSFIAMKKLLDAGLNGPKPYLAIEKFPNYSSILTEYIEADMVSEKNYSKIIESLRQLHKKGFVHTDANLWNFLEKNGKIYMIDCRMKKNYLGKIAEAYDFVCIFADIDQKNKNYPEIQNTVSYRIAYSYILFQRFLRKVKQNFRKFFG